MIVTISVTLTACRNPDFVNLSSFIDGYNAMCEEGDRIDFSSFVLEKSETVQTASFFPFGGSLIAVRLESDNSKQIGEARILIRKTDEKTKERKPTEDELSLFLQACRNTVYALSNGGMYEIPASVMPSSASQLYEETEKTADADGYYFIYYSNKLVSEVIIRNSKLKQTETTKKPENKQPFAQLTQTRENTVPHK